MKNEPTAMREVHEIRAKIFEETKDMTPEERAAHASRGAQELIAMYGLNVKRPDSPSQVNIVQIGNDASYQNRPAPQGVV